MIPQVVKKIQWSDLRYADGDSWVSTKLLKKLNITEDEPFQIKGGQEMVHLSLLESFGKESGKHSALLLKNKQTTISTICSKAKRKRKNITSWSSRVTSRNSISNLQNSNYST